MYNYEKQKRTNRRSPTARHLSPPIHEADPRPDRRVSALSNPDARFMALSTA